MKGERRGRGRSFSTDRWDLGSSWWWWLAVVVSWAALNSKYQTWDVLVLSRTRPVRRWLVEAGGVEVLGGLHDAGCLGWYCPKELGTWSEDVGDCRGLVIRLGVARWTVDGRLRRESVCLIVYHCQWAPGARRGGTRHFTGPGPSFMLGTIPQWPLGPGHLSSGLLSAHHRPRVTPYISLVTPLAPPLSWLSPQCQTMRCASSWVPATGHWHIFHQPQTTSETLHSTFQNFDDHLQKKICVLKNKPNPHLRRPRGLLRGYITWFM